MSNSETLQVTKRDKVGSRDSRKLRAAGRIPCSLQSNDEKENVNFHISEVEFSTARRSHVHLFDLDVGGGVESAIVREIQWDLMGDNIVHVEFKRVVRGVEIDSSVTLSYVGQVKEGVFSTILNEVTIKSIPSMIPDEIVVKIEGLVTGDHIRAADLILPEGCTLGCAPETELAVVSGAKLEIEETEPAEDVVSEEGTPPEPE